MTKEQAAAELGRLCGALGKSPKELTPQQGSEWLKALCGIGYEKGRAAVQAVIDQWERTSFPPVGFFNARARQIDFEGQPNASAYSQDGDRTPWHHSDQAAFDLWVMEQVQAFRFPLPLLGEPDELTPEVQEERYWAYVTDREYKRRCNDAWRRMWAERTSEEAPDNVRSLAVARGRRS